MLLLSKEDIKEVFTMEDTIEAVREAFVLFSKGLCEVPLRTQIQAKKQGGTFLFMPAYAEALGNASLKIVNIFPQNIKKNLPTAPAQVLLIDGENGMISAILDGTYLTQLRTGAASGVAFELLAIKDAKVGAIIGTGSQAREQLAAMLSVRALEEVRLYSIDYQQTIVFAKEMQKAFQNNQTKIIAVSSADEAIENADMIVTVTSSNKPVFDGNKVKAGAVVSGVGSYQPQMQETDPTLLKRASKIYFDSTEAVLLEAGDILIPLQDNLISKEDFTGDIGDLLQGKIVGRENDSEIIFFKTVGIGMQDLVTAKRIYEKAVKKEIGTDVF